MIYIFSKSMYRAEGWAKSHDLRRDQYKIFLNPRDIWGYLFTQKDRLIVLGVISQFMLNAIQVAMGKPEGAPEIEFYP